MERTPIRYVVYAILLSIIAPYLYDRRFAVSVLVRNRDPANWPRINNFKQHAVVFADAVRNCEDVRLDESRGLAYLSCDPGRDRWNTVLGEFSDPDYAHGTLYLYDYSSASPSSPGAISPLPITWLDASIGTNLHPLGTTLDTVNARYYVIDHAKTGPAIHILQLSADGRSATHTRTVRHPLLHAPNSVTALDAHTLLVTNDKAFTAEAHPFLTAAETYLGYPGGTLVHVDLAAGTRSAILADAAVNVTTLAHIPFANGVAPLNATHLAVASTTMPALLIFALDRAAPSATLQRRVRPRFLADNLFVDASGAVLVAGHPHIKQLAAVASSNKEFELDGRTGAGARGLGPESARKRAGSWVSEWRDDGSESGVLRDLYIGGLGEYGASTTAVRDVKRNVGIVVGLYEKGILLFKE